jgi:hypothetical protein
VRPSVGMRPPAPMTSERLLAELGRDRVDDRPDRKHSISGFVLRGRHEPLVAVGGERSPTDHISGFLDALYVDH